MSRFHKRCSIDLKGTGGTRRSLVTKVANDREIDQRYAQATFERVATRESLGDCC